MNAKVIKNTLIIFAICCFFSCGYKFVGDSSMPENIRSVSVYTFKNNTTESGVESVIANDLISEFMQNNVDVVDLEDADAYLKGVVKSITTYSVSHTDINISDEIKVAVAVDVNLFDKNGNIVWSAIDLREDEVYALANKRMGSEVAKSNAISALSERLAEKIYHNITQRF